MNKIVFTGTYDNVKKALQYFEDTYREIGSFVTIPLSLLFDENILKELQIKVGGRYNVDLQQRDYGGGSTQLTIKG